MEELGKEHWKAQLNGAMLVGASAGGTRREGTLPSFQEWLHKKKMEEKRRSWIPKESKSSLLRKSHHRADEEQGVLPPEAAMPEAVETLGELEKRIRAKIEQQDKVASSSTDVAAEPLLMEIQAYDGLFSDSLLAAERISPTLVSPRE